MDLNRKAQKKRGKDRAANYEAGKKALKDVSSDKDMTYPTKVRKYIKGREAEKIADSVRGAAAREKRLNGKPL